MVNTEHLDHRSMTLLNRWFLDCLDVASTLDRELDRSSQSDGNAIFTPALAAIRRIAPLDSVAFLVVNEDLEFEINLADPPNSANTILEEVSRAVDDGVFGWAISRNRAVVTHQKDSQRPALLHVIATRSKVFGMLFAQVDSTSPMIPDVASKMLSVILSSCAAALEASQLRAEIDEHAETIESRVRERTAEIERACGEAQDASCAKGRFLSVVSRDLLRPIEAMMGETRQLLEGCLDGDQLRHLENLSKNAETLRATVNQILDFSEIEAGEVAIASESFDFREVLDGVHVRSVEFARDKGLELDISYGEDFPHRLVGDAERISQIVSCLTRNAIRFTQEGRVEIHVECRAEGLNRAALRIAVADTSEGIARDSLDTVFEASPAANESEKDFRTGADLGLTVAHLLAELMGGELTATSQLGSGSTFELSLTLSVNREEKRALEAEESAAPARRVLVVEDDPISRKVTVRILQKLGCDVDTALDGAEAIEHFERSLYDLILMDCGLPDVNGYEATKQIRALEGDRQRTPIIALTADNTKEDRYQCLAAGMDYYVGKPVKQDVLKSVLARWSRSSHSGADGSGGDGNQT